MKRLKQNSEGMRQWRNVDGPHAIEIAGSKQSLYIWREQLYEARREPGHAAAGYFPYPHRTVAEWMS